MFERLRRTIQNLLGSPEGGPCDCHSCRYDRYGLDLVTLEGGERLWTHPRTSCKALPCTIHALTDHPMRAFPQHWRADRRIMERICPHGIGHPDPDEWAIREGLDDGRHGCDGCCRVPA